jgi:hypothetical protein
MDYVDLDFLDRRKSFLDASSDHRLPIFSEQPTPGGPNWQEK